MVLKNKKPIDKPQIVCYNKDTDKARTTKRKD